MFDQTFVETQRVANRPLTLVLSLSFQVSVVCVLAVVPLLYTQVLPMPLFKDLLVAPAPPRAAVPVPPDVKPSPKLAARTLDLHKLFAPTAIPKKVAGIDRLTSAPDLGVPGGISETATAANPGIGIIGSVPGTLPPPPEVPQAKKAATGPIHVVTALEEANLVRRVIPVYPPLAKSARIQGTVEFTALISKTGTIENLKLVHGHPLLVNAAKEAVEQWKYRPTLLNGVPVEVVTDIIVNFTLNQ